MTVKAHGPPIIILYLVLPGLVTEGFQLGVICSKECLDTVKFCIVFLNNIVILVNVEFLRKYSQQIVKQKTPQKT